MRLPTRSAFRTMKMEVGANAIPTARTCLHRCCAAAVLPLIAQTRTPARIRAIPANRVRNAKLRHRLEPTRSFECWGDRKCHPKSSRPARPRTMYRGSLWTHEKSSMVVRALAATPAPIHIATEDSVVS